MDDTIKRVVIPAGTLLYRAAPITELRPVYYNAIQKKGIVFSTYPFFELAQVLGTNRPSRLGVYQLTRNIEVLEGRYSFRKLDRKLYYYLNKIPKKIQAAPRHNLSHLDTDIYPKFSSTTYDRILWSKNYRELLGLKKTDGEVFLGQQEHLDALRFVKEYIIPLEDLSFVLKRAKYQATSKDYYEHLQLVKQQPSDAIYQRNWNSPFHSSSKHISSTIFPYQHISETPNRYITIPAGTFLYRAAPKIEKRFLYSPETKKYGIYFATYMFLALAMVVEYKESMRLGVFRLNRDIRVLRGKYSARKGENLSHFDPDIYARLGDIMNIRYFIKASKRRELHHLDGELFIGEADQIDAIDFVAEYFVPYEGLKELLRQEKYRPYSSKYIEHMQFLK